jgi:hypothetical protein
MPQEVAEAFAALREESRASAEREFQLAKLARPTKKERKAMAELRGIEGHKPGLRELGSEHAERIQNADLSNPVSALEMTTMDNQPASPEPSDPSFWWARTDWSLPNFYRADLRSDGLHFTGKFTYDANPLFGFSFGATASFGIDSDRLPFSPSGRWRSAPHVELFGGLLGWTGPYDIFDGDSWCKVWMVRRQTVFQWAFGPSGPVLVKRGEAIEAPQLINEENAHRTFRRPMPGFQRMPTVEFGGIFPGTVWSHLEVRFDVQLEGNSFLWLDPEVLLRTFQWPAVAI